MERLKLNSSGLSASMIAGSMVEPDINIHQEMVAHLDSHLKWLRSTPAEQEFLGYSLDELQKKSLLELIHPDDRVKAGVDDAAVIYSLASPAAPSFIDSIAGYGGRTAAALVTKKETYFFCAGQSLWASAGEVRMCFWLPPSGGIDPGRLSLSW